MNFENNDYVKCDYLTDKVILWVLNQMYLQARNEGCLNEEHSDSFSDFKRGDMYNTLAYYKVGDNPVIIYFSGLPDGSWKRDITLDVFKCYLEENL